MPITEERIGELAKFGFTETAARVYLALLDLGVAEARDISTLSRVPTSKIYHTLDQLHGRGLVTIYPEYPKRYAPTPFREFLLKLKMEHEAEATRIETNIDRLASRFGVKGGAEMGSAGEFTVLRGRRNVMEKAAELIDHAEREVLLLGTRGTASRVRKMPEHVERAHKRGVLLRGMFPMDEDILHDLETLHGIYEIRERVLDEEGLGENVAILVTDGHHALISHFSPDDWHLYQGQDVAIYTDHEAVVRALHAILQSLWGGAQDYRTRRADLETGRTRAFMRLLTDHRSFHRAVIEALDRGVSRIRVLKLAPRAAWNPAWEEAFSALGRHVPVHVQFLVATADPRLVNALGDRVEPYGSVEVRHSENDAYARCILFDDREALIALDDADVGESLEETRQLILHTTNPEVVAALAAQFEELWTEAPELKAP